MKRKELEHYRNWLLHTPHDVLEAVKLVGGWHSLFQSSVPRWANKVRNYFNVNPRWLRRLDKGLSAKHLTKAQKYIRIENPIPAVKDPKPNIHPVQPGVEKLIELFATTNALSGDVYLSDGNRIWFQMSPGATIYHYGDQPTVPAGEAAWATAKTQSLVPVFKLVSPDRTGGSQECCINNPVVDWIILNGTAMPLRASSIGDVNEPVNVSNRIVDDPALQGSYNYSETIEMGLAHHNLRDVKPHTGEFLLYSNPSSLFSSLTARRFPMIDSWGHILEDQK